MKNNWEMRHVGFVVHDLDRATDYYKSLGIGTIGPEQIFYTANDAKLRAKFVQVGSIEIEFLQPLEGESIQLRYLRKHGEGIQHLAFNVKNIDKEINKLTKNGVKLKFKIDAPDHKIAYFDTGRIGDVLIELVQAST